jgi:hypothetical protein
MTDRVFVKKTDDGVEIKMNPETGSFEAFAGCTCEGQHSTYIWDGRCPGKTIRRSSLAVLERELAKVAKPLSSVKAIAVGAWADPRVIEIASIEKVGGEWRYRRPNGELLSRSYSLCVWSEDV